MQQVGHILFSRTEPSTLGPHGRVSLVLQRAATRHWLP
jgi:hypothetical protein